MSRSFRHVTDGVCPVDLQRLVSKRAGQDTRLAVVVFDFLGELNGRRLQAV